MHWKNEKQPLLKLQPFFQNAAENMATVGDTLSAESYLSGITKEQQAVLRDLAAKSLVPDRVEARADVEFERSFNAARMAKAETVHKLALLKVELHAAINDIANDPELVAAATAASQHSGEPVAVIIDRALAPHREALDAQFADDDLTPVPGVEPGDHERALLNILGGK